MDAEAPVNYVAQLSGHKNLKKPQTTPAQDAFGFEQRREKIFHLLKRCTSQTSSQSLGARVIQTAKKQASLGKEQGFSGLLFNIRSIDGSTFNFSFNSAPCSSGENIPRSKQRKRHDIISDDSDSD